MAKTSTNSTYITGFRMSEEEVRQLRDLARAEDRSVSGQVRHVLGAWLADQPKPPRKRSNGRRARAG